MRSIGLLIAAVIFLALAVVSCRSGSTSLTKPGTPPARTIRSSG